VSVDSRRDGAPPGAKLVRRRLAYAAGPPIAREAPHLTDRGGRGAGDASRSATAPPPT